MGIAVLKDNYLTSKLHEALHTFEATGKQLTLVKMQADLPGVSDAHSTLCSCLQ